jgi:hypothetical protein
MTTPTTAQAVTTAAPDPLALVHQGIDVARRWPAATPGSRRLVLHRILRAIMDSVPDAAREALGEVRERPNRTHC